MKALSVGNGQTNNIGMNLIVNTLDCMHDAQAVLIRSDTNWMCIPKKLGHYVRTHTLEVIRDKMPLTTCCRLSKIHRGGVYRQRLTQIIGKEQGTDMGKSENTSSLSGRKYVLRRLTPLECLRLMGLPDWWVDGAEGSDSAIYKMCGNGLGIPCSYDVIRRIAKELEKSNDHK